MSTSAESASGESAATTPVQVPPLPTPQYTPAVKAYKNVSFLNSDSSRSVRILCEYEVRGSDGRGGIVISSIYQSHFPFFEYRSHISASVSTASKVLLRITNIHVYIPLILSLYYLRIHTFPCNSYHFVLWFGACEVKSRVRCYQG